jgi:hypothetical protein
MELNTIPRRIYKESDQLWPVEEDGQLDTCATESWSFYIVAKLTRCITPVHPLSAKIELISNKTVVKTFTVRRSYLEQFTVPEEKVATRTRKIYLLIWNHFIEPRALEIDGLRYTLLVQDSEKARFENTLEIPVRRYEQKAKLIFPLRGKCIVAVGHEYNEHHRLERSQFAYDVFPLGPNGELIRRDGSANEDWWGYGSSVVAPAEGKVIYARDDISENDRPGVLPDEDFYKNIPDQLTATAGNHVIIDHGHQEYSLLAHLKHGSVEVQKGDNVTKEQLIGCVGNSGRSGAPHLHYDLMNDPDFSGDGLPSNFENLKLLGLKGRIKSPKRGLFLVAE